MRLAVVLVLLLCLSLPAAAQDCAIAPYWDHAGTRSVGSPDWIDGVYQFSVFVVMFTEDTAAAAAYSLTTGFSADGPFLQARFSGPSGNGLVIDEPTGTNVALAECAIGFGGLPVLIDEYWYIAFEGYSGGAFSLGPNLSQGPVPVYVTCNDLTKPCAVGPDLYVWVGFPTESRSFGAVKSLFVR